MQTLLPSRVLIHLPYLCSLYQTSLIRHKPVQCRPLKEH